MAYWLGMLFADGNVFVSKARMRTSYRTSLSLKCSDYQHVLEFKNALQSSYAISLIKKDPPGQSCRTQHAVYSDTIGMDLIDLGCVPQKSLILDWPSRLPDQHAHHFIRGYFDGDGCGCYNSSRRNIDVQFAGSLKFIPKLQSYIKTHVLYSSRFSGSVGKISGGNCLLLAYGGNATPMKVLDWMYTGSESSTRLNRKYQYYLEWKKVMHLRSIPRDFKMREYLDSIERKELSTCKQNHICPHNKITV